MKDITYTILNNTENWITLTSIKTRGEIRCPIANTRESHSKKVKLNIMHVTVNFLGLFFRTGKIFFGLTRFSCLSVRMTDNFSASFGKSGLKSRRVIKCPLLADRHRRTRLAWRLARRGWNLWTWRKIHWSDESRFLLHATNGRMSIWRHKNTAYTPRNTHPTVPYGGGSVMV